MRAQGTCFEPLGGVNGGQLMDSSRRPPVGVTLELPDIEAILEGQAEDGRAQPACRASLCWNGTGPRTRSSPDTAWLASLRQVT